MQILFEGGCYSGAGTIIFTHVMMLAPSDGAQTRVDLGVDTSCGRQVDLYRFFPTRAGISPLVYMYQPPPSSRASPLALLMHGHKYLSGRVQILIEGGYYFIQHGQLCGYYSKADTIRRAGTIWGNTVPFPAFSRINLGNTFVLMNCMCKYAA